MLLDDTELYNSVWDQVYRRLKFKPDCMHRAHTFEANVPFEIEGRYAVYGIEQMEDANIDALAGTAARIFREVTKENERIYALDWHHSAFLYHPGDKEEQSHAYFPSFFPDGDYYFFIDENFRFGYLGHPWRQEVWIFGEVLVRKFEEVYRQLGWVKLK